MSIRLNPSAAYADLGEIWLRDQLARLAQKHLQFGRHYRIEADALLAQSACSVRVAKAAAAWWSPSWVNMFSGAGLPGA